MNFSTLEQRQRRELSVLRTSSALASDDEPTELQRRNDAIRAQLDAELFSRLTERERHEP